MANLKSLHKGEPCAKLQGVLVALYYGLGRQTCLNGIYVACIKLFDELINALYSVDSGTLLRIRRA